jgi:hypothetical protein
MLRKVGSPRKLKHGAHDAVQNQGIASPKTGPALNITKITL